MTNKISYRRAGQEDFPGILQLLRTTVDDLLKRSGFAETSPFASSRLPPIPQQGFPWFETARKNDPDGFWVAEDDGELAGITLSWVRGPLWYLAHLFVSPKHQGLNIGQTLLDKAYKHRTSIPITHRALVTFAYNPVSISLYARYGIYPREPLYLMECPKQEVNVHNTDPAVKSEKIDDFPTYRKVISEIDRDNTGFRRDANHEFLFSLPSVQCHLFTRHDQWLGYAYVWKNGRIGPIAALSHSGFKNILDASLELAAKFDPPSVGMLVTGSNETQMKTALEQKMRILDNYLFMSSKPIPNFSNYTLYPTGAML
jgi:GNAT superfamily N-acetyltransferase